jgi:hypothetical protein
MGFGNFHVKNKYAHLVIVLILILTLLYKFQVVFSLSSLLLIMVR